MSISSVLCPCSPGNAGLQPGSGSHAGAWRSQDKPWGTGSVFMKQTSRRQGSLRYTYGRAGADTGIEIALYILRALGSSEYCVGEGIVASRETSRKTETTLTHSGEHCKVFPGVVGRYDDTSMQ